MIGAYVEGVRDGRRFLDALRLAAASKPLVVLKGGRTGAGGRAAASHTAALAGTAAVWEAALTQAGCLSVATVEDLIDMLIAFSRMQPGSGTRLGMVGSGGGRSVLTADLCEELGLAVPPLPADIEAKVAERAPDLAGWITNPVDQSILAGSGLGGGRILEWFDESPEIDLLLANMNEAWAFGGRTPPRSWRASPTASSASASGRRSRSQSSLAPRTTPRRSAGGWSPRCANGWRELAWRSTPASSGRCARWRRTLIIGERERGARPKPDPSRSASSEPRRGNPSRPARP